MIIRSIHIKNFRSLKDVTVNCDSLTALMGPNGSGKSSVLRALELFYAPSPRIEPDDFYNGNTQQDVEIELTFTALSEDAKTRFASYLQGEDLTVVRVFSLQDGRPSCLFHGSRLQNPDFATVRSAANASAAREAYNQLRAQEKYQDLPAWRSKETAQAALEQWEEANPGECTRQRDDGQFFGFMQVAQGYLGQFTRLVPIPAVRDAAEDAAEGRGRPVTEMLDLVVRAALAHQRELQELEANAKKQYEEILASQTRQHLETLKADLVTTLQTYVPDATLDVEWATEGGVTINPPKADVELGEHGYYTAVTRVGHGLQRAFIITMLQHLATVQARRHVVEVTQDEAQPEEKGEAQASVSMPSLVLAIEEPELYQHPSRQRHLAKILLQLASGEIPSVATKIQVIYTTHSPLFVGIDRFDQVRLLRKVPAAQGAPKVTQVTQVHGDAVAEDLWEACDRKSPDGSPVDKFAWETLKPRLQTIMTPWMSEGFFSDLVVLVEGEEDRAAILGAALNREHDLESLGVAVIPCGGKESIDRPLAIFRRFGIPVYPIWDADKDQGSQTDQEKSKRTNSLLLRLLGKELTDWPSGVNGDFACFEVKLEHTLRSEIGEGLFNEILEDLKEEFGYRSNDRALKNPFLMRELVAKAVSRGAACQTLDSIVTAILRLRGIETS